METAQPKRDRQRNPMIRPLILFLSLITVTSMSFGTEVETYQVSPDKTRLALAYDDHVIYFFDLASGKLLHKLKGHGDSIQTLDFNSDGSRLVSGDWDDHLIIWDSASGKILKNKNLGETVMNAHYSAKDKSLVVLVDEHLLATYSPDLSQKIKTFPIFNHLVFSDNRRLFAGEKARTRSGQEPGVILIDPDEDFQLDIPENVYDDEMFFSPDKSKIIIRDYARFHTWDIRKGVKVSSFKAGLSVEMATVTPTSDREILIYGDDEIETWDYQSGQRLKKIQLSGRNIDEIKQIAITPDGKTAAVSAWLRDNRSEVYLMDLATQEIRQTIQPLSHLCLSSEFLDNQRLLLHSNYPIELWDVNQGQRIHAITKSGAAEEASLDKIAQSDFKPYEYGARINGIDVFGGTLIITGDAPHPMGTIEINTDGQLNGLYQNNYLTGYDARFSHSGDLAAFAYHGEHLLVYDTKTRALQAEYDLGGVPSGTRIIKFSRDDHYLAAGSDDGSIDIVDVREKKLIKHLQLYADPEQQEESEGVFALAWLSDQQILVGTLENLFLVDLSTGEQRTILTRPVIALATLFKDNQLQRVGVNQYNGNTLLLDASLKTIKETPDVAQGRIAFSAKGDQLIYTTEQEVHLWDFEKNRISKCTGPEEELYAMAYDTRTGAIYAGGDDGKVFVWDRQCKPLN